MIEVFEWLDFLVGVAVTAIVAAVVVNNFYVSKARYKLQHKKFVMLGERWLDSLEKNHDLRKENYKLKSEVK